MQIIRRLLYIPVLLVLGGALLVIFKIIDFDVTALPISIEVVAIIAGTILAMLGVAEVTAPDASYEHPEPEEPPKSTKIIYPKIMEDAVESMHEAEEFVVKANGRVDIQIDIEEDPEEEV